MHHNAAIINIDRDDFFHKNTYENVVNSHDTLISGAFALDLQLLDG